MRFARALIFTLPSAPVFAASSGEALDRIVFGDAASERAHALESKNLAAPIKVGPRSTVILRLP